LEYKKIKLELLENEFMLKFLGDKFIENILENFYVKKKDYSLQVYSLIVIKMWFDLFEKYILKV
jgi:hypothetical protein